MHLGLHQPHTLADLAQTFTHPTHRFTESANGLPQAPDGLPQAFHPLSDLLKGVLHSRLGIGIDRQAHIPQIFDRGDLLVDPHRHIQPVHAQIPDRNGNVVSLERLLNLL